MISDSVEINEIWSALFVDEEISGMEVSVAAFGVRELVKESQNLLWYQWVNRRSFVDGVQKGRVGAVFCDENCGGRNEGSFFDEEERLRSVDSGFAEARASPERAMSPGVFESGGGFLRKRF